MRDPVTGFEYPQTWLDACDSAQHEQIAAGLCVLTAFGTVLIRLFLTLIQRNCRQ